LQYFVTSGTSDSVNGSGLGSVPPISVTKRDLTPTT
jgi:hypothetical protein